MNDSFIVRHEISVNVAAGGGLLNTAEMQQLVPEFRVCFGERQTKVNDPGKKMLSPVVLRYRLRFGRGIFVREVTESNKYQHEADCKHACTFNILNA